MLSLRRARRGTIPIRAPGTRRRRHRAQRGRAAPRHDRRARGRPPRGPDRGGRRRLDGRDRGGGARRGGGGGIGARPAGQGRRRHARGARAARRSSAARRRPVRRRPGRLGGRAHRPARGARVGARRPRRRRLRPAGGWGVRARARGGAVGRRARHRASTARAALRSARAASLRPPRPAALRPRLRDGGRDDDRRPPRRPAPRRGRAAARPPRHRAHAGRLRPPRPAAPRRSQGGAGPRRRDHRRAASRRVAPRRPLAFRAVILGIDQGTTGTTCLALDAEARVAGRGYREHAQHFPRPGWVEHDPEDLWDGVVATARAALDDAGAEPHDLAAIGITNQRETALAWDRTSGEPLARALVWQDRRTAERCDELRAAGHEPLFRERTGLVLDSYFSGTKWEWLLTHGDVDPRRAALGTVDAWILHKLCRRHATDHSNASRTLGKNTYGTGSFVLQNTGGEAPPPAHGLLSTLAWTLGEERTDYAVEASIFVTGAAVGWLRDGLGIISEAAESEELARSLGSNDGVFFVPALTGLASPHWDPYARGTIVGLTRGSGRAHLARAALEAIAYQTVDAVHAMEAASGDRLAELRVDGAPVENRWLMQFQADVLGVPVLVPETIETTALGAGCLAGVAVGTWTEEDVRGLWSEAARYEPCMSDDERETLLAGWHAALERARGKG